ncbi:MAG: hypothetical protein JST68_18700 [Bacteroidetes bacterium]|nr:hypothetical protein [Bacteroidota bacterium]
MNHSTKTPLMLKTRTLFLYQHSAASRSGETGDTTTITSTMTTTLPVTGTSFVTVGAFAQRPRN